MVQYIDKIGKALSRLSIKEIDGHWKITLKMIEALVKEHLTSPFVMSVYLTLVGAQSKQC